MRGTTLLLAMAIAIAACGSTVQRSGETTAAPAFGADNETPEAAGAGQGAGPGGGATITSPAVASGPSIAVGNTGATSAGAGESQPTATRPPAAPGAGQGAAPPAPASAPAPATAPPSGAAPVPETPSSGAPTVGRGYDDATVYVGFSSASSADQGADAAGLSGVTTGDTAAQVQTLLDDLNARGGLLGRQVQGVFYDADSEGDTDSQAACSRWTEDQPTIAAVSVVGALGRPALYGCLADHDTPLVTSAVNAEGDTIYRQYEPYMYVPGIMGWSVLAPLWVDRLVAQEYFDEGAILGLLRGDSPEGDAISADVRAALGRHGYEVTTEFAYAMGDSAAVLSSVQSSVLQFRSAGVTHMLTVDARAFFFMLAAAEQAYFPRYAVSSYNAPGFLLQPNVGPSGQLEGAVGVGFLPVYDVDEVNDPGPVSPRVDRCLQLFEDAGVAAERSEQTVAMSYCEDLGVLEEAVTAVGGFSTAALQSGVQAISGSYESALTFRTRFGPGRVDGAAAVRDLQFLTECSCFRYTSDNDHVAG